MSAQTLDQASAIVDAVLAKAREPGLRPLAVTVLDPGGKPVVLEHEDHAGNLRHGTARTRARACVGLGMGRAPGGRNDTRDRAFFPTLAAISDGRIAASCGGV
jgi:uncharacterized protein GlcG (DUF336 family)